jgi:curved DNA-binding protein CbpA
METLYDLLGALPNDDADSLRAAFRRAAKGAHPDVNPGDPDAGLNFRRIVRAHEILGDVEQRAAYDRLLEVTRLEQVMAAKQAVAAKVHQLGSGVVALTGVLAVAVGGYALFLQLSANTLAPATATAEAIREPAAIVAARPAEEDPSSASAPPPQPSAGADVTISSRTMPAAQSIPSDIAETARGRVGPQLDRAPKHASRFRSAYIDHSIILYHLRKFARFFTELGPAKRLERVSRLSASSSPLSQINTR